jgi:lipid II:glycine glycyltransferase (peptidoglycan interpeptide bridge formation enzyme)
MLGVGARRGFPVRSEAYYEQLWTHFLKVGDGALVLAEHEGALIAGLLAIATGPRAWLLYTGLVDGGRALHPNEAVWWEALCWARKQGAAVFDLGGSGTDWPPVESSPGWSVYWFKRGFGAEAVLLTGYYDLPFKPALYRGFRLLEEQVLPRVAASTLFQRFVKS